MKKLCRLVSLSTLAFLLSTSALFSADLVVTAANVAPSGNGTKYAVANAAPATTIAPGQAVAKDSNGRFILADANAVSPAYKVIGIALNAATAGQPVKAVTSDPKFVPGVTLVIGDTIWLSATPGGLTKTAADNVTGMYVSCLGVAVSTTEMKLNITRADAVKP